MDCERIPLWVPIIENREENLYADPLLPRDQQGFYRILRHENIFRISRARASFAESWKTYRDQFEAKLAASVKIMADKVAPKIAPGVYPSRKEMQQGEDKHLKQVVIRQL